MSRENFAVLGLGSNLGKKSQNLCDALKRISTFCKIIKTSSVYKTASLLRDGQGAYFNMCAYVSTYMEPDELLAALKQIEKAMGRENTGRWYTRVIDIDIIDLNNAAYSSDRLNLPHPQMGVRSFVLYPLREILPSYVHPVSCLSIDNMVKMIRDDLGIQKLGVALWQL